MARGLCADSVRPVTVAKRRTARYTARVEKNLPLWVLPAVFDRMLIAWGGDLNGTAVALAEMHVNADALIHQVNLRKDGPDNLHTHMTLDTTALHNGAGARPGTIASQKEGNRKHVQFKFSLCFSKTVFI